MNIYSALKRMFEHPNLEMSHNKANVIFRFNGSFLEQSVLQGDCNPVTWTKAWLGYCDFLAEWHDCNPQPAQEPMEVLQQAIVDRLSEVERLALETHKQLNKFISSISSIGKDL